MKYFKRLNLAIVLFAVAVIVSSLAIGSAMAADQKMDTVLARDVVTKLDKNSQPYSRAIVVRKMSLEGIEYDKEVVVMAFGGASDLIKGMKKGDQLTAIVSPREYQGSTSYTLNALIQ